MPRIDLLLSFWLEYPTRTYVSSSVEQLGFFPLFIITGIHSWLSKQDLGCFCGAYSFCFMNVRNCLFAGKDVVYKDLFPRNSFSKFFFSFFHVWKDIACGHIVVTVVIKNWKSHQFFGKIVIFKTKALEWIRNKSWGKTETFHLFLHYLFLLLIYYGVFSIFGPLFFSEDI